MVFIDRIAPGRSLFLPGEPLHLEIRFFGTSNRARLDVYRLGRLVLSETGALEDLHDSFGRPAGQLAPTVATIHIPASELDTTADYRPGFITAYWVAVRLEPDGQNGGGLNADRSYQDLGAAGAPTTVDQRASTSREERASNSTAATAIQVGRSGDMPIRYGFVTDFEQTDASASVQSLTEYNLTHIQFYDWMYRHEQLVCDHPVYRDALGRTIDASVVKGKIETAHKKGIRSIAYGAIYGAGMNYAAAHPEQRLFRRDGTPHTLGDFLSIMNVSSENPWHRHVIDQYRQAVEVFGFHGIHMDTYGFPKRAYDAAGKVVDIDAEIPSLVADTRASLSEGQGRRPVGAPDQTAHVYAEPEAVVDRSDRQTRASLSSHDSPVDSLPTLIFNAVNGWPLEAAARSPVDTLYIEVWPPNTRYRDLVRLAREARHLKPNPPILAAYLTPFCRDSAETGLEPMLSSEATGAGKSKDANQEAVWSVLYATAVIYTAGATHLILGENYGVLCDPYYANHGNVPKWARTTVGRYYNFAAAYAELLAGPGTDITLTHAHGPDDEVSFHGMAVNAFPEAGAVWAAVRETKRHYVVSLVNLTGCVSDEWNREQPAPGPDQRGLQITFTVAEALTTAYSACPEEQKPQELELVPTDVERGPAYLVEVPPIKLWRVVWVEKGEPR